MSITNSPNHILMYNSVIASEQFAGLPGVDKWNSTRKVWGHNGAIIDRTGVVITPFKTKVLDWLLMPEVDHSFNKTLEECCLAHAREIINTAKQTNKTISIMWSGGIDSTCTVSSFLMEATVEERKLITVLLNRDSMLENHAFYKTQLIGKVNCKDSNIWENYIRDNNLFITGEGGDQLCWFGFTRASQKIFNDIGWDQLRKPATADMLIKCLQGVSHDRGSAVHGYECVLDPLRKNSKIPVDSLGQVFWYMNFAVKWQNVYIRMFNNIVDRSLVSEEYARNNFIMFYQSADIQRWAMLNNEKVAWVDKFTDIKRPLKEIIYKFDGNQDYLDNKVKLGSLGKLSRLRTSVGYITSDWKFTNTLDTLKYYNNDNSFI